MEPGSDDELVSYNAETGLIEDIEEVRALAINVINGFLRLASLPVIQATTQPGEAFDLLFSLVLIRAMMRPTSQAQLYREMAALFGQPPEITEREIIQMGMSETHAYTSEQATTLAMDRQAIAERLRQGVLYPSSEYIQDAVAAVEAAARATQLPDNLERFLQQVQGRATNDDTSKTDSGTAPYTGDRSQE